MTIYGATDPIVMGQPMSPFFGAQNGNGKAATAAGAAPIIPSPNASVQSGPQVTLLESVARGAMPRNAGLVSVGGIGMGNGDNCSVDEAMSNGNGAQTCEGGAIPNNPGVPTNAATLNIGSPQIFADGVSQGPAVQVTGPTAFNTESLTSAPTLTSTLVNQVVVGANLFQG